MNIMLYTLFMDSLILQKDDLNVGPPVKTNSDIVLNNKLFLKRKDLSLI